MEFFEIVKSRYATKKFDGRMVDNSRIEQLLEMIRLAPSSYNVQPWKIKVITDAKTKQELLGASYNQPQITTCSHLLVFCADTDLENRLKNLCDLMRSANVPEENVNQFYNMVNGFISSLPAEQRLSWAKNQVYLAVGNALNGAKALGLDSCPMEGFDAKAYSKILKLPANLVPSVVVPVGYAADTPRPKLRFAKKDVFF
jgi:nitroreductase